ncbi:hypothetical protein Aspvir_004103 [Aspergillus viridinutans]|uniref:Uncharacterized protein n=1 Tax=Aspergillus viridinutans TaxID=75553 RepID=A0A9P3F3J5_ASPVI|nr:uncharacterized protein Aspvir_004103 [Aspergillus viridinutans]GIK00088.1 hypothetical protein Aspvir_004103 [Aspergillus viridinutans]
MAYKLLVTFIIPLVPATATCYWPDGSVAKTNTPCSSGPNASCCGSHNICLSNNLCLDALVQPYVLSRGGCTDPNWESDECPSVCRNVSTSSAVSLVTLGKGSNGAVSYCCGVPVSNGRDVVCGDGHSVQVTDGEIIAGYAALANVSSLDGGNSSASSTSSNSSADTSTHSSHEVAVGVGVGVPLAVIALASIVWAIWERRTRMQHVKDAMASATMNGGQVHPYAEKYPGVGVPPHHPAELTAESQTHELQS